MGNAFVFQCIPKRAVVEHSISPEIFVSVYSYIFLLYIAEYSAIMGDIVVNSMKRIFKRGVADGWKEAETTEIKKEQGKEEMELAEISQEADPREKTEASVREGEAEVQEGGSRIQGYV